MLPPSQISSRSAAWLPPIWPPEHQSISSFDNSVYVSHDPLPFALAFWIEYASAIAPVTAKLQQEPQLPWLTTGLMQPLYSCLKS